MIKKFNLFTFIVFFSLFVFLSLWYLNKTNPRGDEIHYLITAISIVKDHDIDLKNNYNNFDYRIYYPKALDKHTVTVKSGKEYLYHGLGIYPLIISIPYLLGGRYGIMLFTLICSSFLLYLIFQDLNKISNNSIFPFLICLLIALNYPLGQYSYLIFPEVVGALLIYISTRELLNKNFSTLLIVGSSLLPWIHLRFLTVAIFFTLIIMVNNLKQSIIPTFSIISFLIFNKLLFGSFDPTYSYILANIPRFTGNMILNLLNMLVDKVYGLFNTSPLFILIIPGIYFWLKEKKMEALLILSICLIYLIPILRYSDWNGGYSPPGRYLAPIITILIPSIAYLFLKTRKIIFYLYLIIAGGWGITSFYINITHESNHGFLFMDGYSPFFEYLSTKIGYNFSSYFYSFYPNKIYGVELTYSIIAVLIISLFFIKFNVKKKKLQTSS